ncbi:hypothetical protein GE061_003600 [Apolygus lucorum]|uniref:DUF4795 domain-containing protein n=1 Tax=Apolygus lucorum TaxID=248454 RepID=A0A6A4JHQ0_APOLU|nr:hypothetical protein GE061_003600 [Apolygus lucorum]
MPSAILKMPDLLNMACDLTEKGGPDLLRTALLAMVNHLSMRDLKIEFRGSDAKKIEDLAKQSKTEDGRAINVQVVSDAAMKETESATAESVASSEGIGKKVEEDFVIVENGIVRESVKRRSVSVSSLMRLESKVRGLQVQLEALHTTNLPTDDALLEATRSKQEAKPITDLMQSLNITKRMSGAEEGLDKLASLLETVAREYADLKQIIEKMQSELGDNITDTMETIKMAAKYAKIIKPREDLLGKYRIGKRDDWTSTESSGVLRTVVGKAMGMVEGMFGATPSTGGPQLATDSALGLSQKTKSPSAVQSSTKLTTESKTIGSQSVTVKSQDLPPSQQQIPTLALDGSYPTQTIQPEATLEPSSFMSVIPRLKPEDKIDPDNINKLLAQHEFIKKNMEFMNAQINTLAEFADNILPEILAGLPHATELRRRILELQKDTKPSCPDGPEDVDDVIVTSKDLTERMEGAEARLIKHQAKLKRQDMMIAEKTLDLDNRIGKLTKSLGDIVDVLGLKKHKHKPKEEEEMDQLFGKIGNVEEALIEIGCATQNLLDDKEYKMTLLENLTEEMKLLKTLKLDRFEMEDILANKADCDELNKKVPLDRFDEVTNDLARGIDEALNKVSAQESLLASTLIDIQGAIETKFDKADVEALKEEINNQIQTLKDELAKLAAFKEGKVAAGGKKKFITDVNCLSCDRNVSMPTETDVPCIPAMADLTHMRSIRPFITYELEYLRKMKIKDPEIIKYIEYEELFRRYKLRATDSYENLASVPHLKNRYCGGAHTTTGPLQKVPHTGHFDLKSGSNKNV